MKKESSTLTKLTRIFSSIPAARVSRAIPPVNSLLSPSLALRAGGGGPAGSSGGRPRRFGVSLLPTNGSTREDCLLSPALSSGGGEGADPARFVGFMPPVSTASLLLLAALVAPLLGGCQSL